MWNRLRYLLFPFSWLYGLGVWFRHLLYNKGVLPSMQFNKPIIGVGNLAVGGAGKSPMIEYLVRLLANRYRISTLSRGYGRRTEGLLEVSINDAVQDVGDEPLQFKRKFPEITVLVSENRVKAVEKYFADTDVFLLDDSFQHRAIKPGMNVLLFEYTSLLKPRLLLPAGNFRDLFGQRKRAQGMIVTKTPKSIQGQDKKRIERILKPTPDQWLLFAYLKYGIPYSLGGGSINVDFSKIHTVLLVTGIANPTPLQTYLEDQGKQVIPMFFPDHHLYTAADLNKIETKFRGITNAHSAIVTTVKDEQRLRQNSNVGFFQRMPVFSVPVEMEFSSDDQDFFEKRIMQYCSRYDN